MTAVRSRRRSSGRPFRALPEEVEEGPRVADARHRAGGAEGGVPELALQGSPRPDVGVRLAEVLAYDMLTTGVAVAKISLQLELLPWVPAGPSMGDVKVDLTSGYRQGILDE